MEAAELDRKIQEKLELKQCALFDAYKSAIESAMQCGAKETGKEAARPPLKRPYDSISDSEERYVGNKIAPLNNSEPSSASGSDLNRSRDQQQRLYNMFAQEVPSHSMLPEAELYTYWSLEELEKFEAEATNKYNEATTEQLSAEESSALLRKIPAAIKEHYNLGSTVESNATAELCMKIKGDIFQAIREVRLAWVHYTFEQERRNSAEEE